MMSLVILSIENAKVTGTALGDSGASFCSFTVRSPWMTR